MDDPRQPDPTLEQAIRRFRDAAARIQTRQESLRESYEKARAELERTRQALVTALEVLPRAAALVGSGGEVLAYNARFGEMGLAEAERIHEPRLRALLAEAASGEPFEGRFERRSGSGTEVLLVEARPAGEAAAWVIQVWRASTEPTPAQEPDSSSGPGWAARGGSSGPEGTP